MTSEDSTKKAALYMLRKGLATYSEIAELSGRSRQIIAVWGKDYPKARATHLAAAWERALQPRKR